MTNQPKPVVTALGRRLGGTHKTIKAAPIKNTIKRTVWQEEHTPPIPLGSVAYYRGRQPTETPMTNITISHDFVNELQGVVEDSIEFTIREFASQGELVSGESAWKVLEALAVAKQAQFAGDVDWHNNTQRDIKHSVSLCDKPHYSSPPRVIIKG